MQNSKMDPRFLLFGIYTLHDLLALRVVRTREYDGVINPFIR